MCVGVIGSKRMHDDLHKLLTERVVVTTRDGGMTGNMVKELTWMARFKEIRTISFAISKRGGTYFFRDCFTGIESNERVFFWQFNDDVAAWFAERLKGPFGFGLLHAQSYYLKAFGFSERERKAIFAKRYPEYRGGNEILKRLKRSSEEGPVPILEIPKRTDWTKVDS